MTLQLPRFGGHFHSEELKELSRCQGRVRHLRHGVRRIQYRSTDERVPLPGPDALPASRLVTGRHHDRLRLRQLAVGSGLYHPGRFRVALMSVDGAFVIGSPDPEGPVAVYQSE
jgi:hypothetical protein